MSSKYYQSYKDAGICWRCREAYSGNSVLCEVCKADRREYQSMRAKEAAKKGLCCQCFSKPRAHGYKSCSGCLQRARSYYYRKLENAEN